MDKILTLLPANKQNIVFTTRRSKETQDTLNKILKTPAEIKVDKAKEQEAEMTAQSAVPAKAAKTSGSSHNRQPVTDNEALELVKKYNSFNGKTPNFLINKGLVVNID